MNAFLVELVQAIKAVVLRWFGRNRSQTVTGSKNRTMKDCTTAYAKNRAPTRRKSSPIFNCLISSISHLRIMQDRQCV